MEFSYLVFTKSLMKKLFVTPLLWFVLTGIALFVIDSKNQANSTLSIQVSQGDIQRIRDQWQAQSGTPVKTDMLNALLQEHIQERRLYLEALALGLDKNDVIVRRRLAQKLRFLTEDLPDKQDKLDGELEDFFDNHRQDYLIPAEISFRHIYFNTDLSSQTDIDNRNTRVQTVLSALQAETDSWQSHGDIFMLGRIFSNRPILQIKQQFGSGFSNRLTELNTKTWLGPISSPFGLHLVYVDEYIAASSLPFLQAREQVALDYRAAQRKQSYSRYLQTLADKYPAVIEPEQKTTPLASNQKANNRL